MPHREVRKIVKIGNSLGIVLTKDVLEEMDWKQGDAVELICTKKGLQIEKQEEKLLDVFGDIS